MHLLDCIYIYQVELFAFIHEDSGQMKAVNYGIEYKRRYATVTDVGQVVFSVKDGRISDHGLYYVPPAP